MSLNHFTPVSGLIGGSLIGLSAATLLLFNGNILGASGLAASLVVTPRKTLTEDSQHWKLSFIAAFALTTRLYVSYIDPDALKDARLANDLNATVVSPMGFVIGGFLVGFGTRLGNGCTTGHGICGLARLSVRSLSGVLAFMATGMFSATGCSPTCPFNKYLRASVETVKNYFPTETTKNIGTILASLAAGVALPGFLRKAPESASKSERDEYDSNRSKIITSVVSGALFSVGLVISKMTLASKIYGFLDVKGIKGGYWDPTLVCVMGGGLVVSFLSYQWVKGFNVFQNSKALECPLSQKKSVGHFDVPTNQVIDFNLIFGEALFGLGWGAAGLCPGPAMFLAFAGYPNVLLRWWPSFFVGSLLAEQLKNAQLRLAKNKKID